MNLCVKNLCITACKENRELVKGVDFCISQGQSLILLGQSGSGKTMTCRAIMGLLDPGRFYINGEILLDQRNLLTLPLRDRLCIYGGDIAFIPQNPMTALDPSVRIGRQMDETLALHGRASKAERKARILESLSQAGLTDGADIYRAYPHMLSGGMLQRVLIAMTMMGQAKIVIADEPTTALDVVHRNETINSFLQLREKGVGIFMVTHDFSAAAQLGGTVLIMKDGNILERGPINEVLASPKAPYTKDLISASALSRIRTGGQN